MSFKLIIIFVIFKVAWSCELGQYRCYLSGECIDAELICNGEYDCKYRDDERNCSYNLNSTHNTARNGQCKPGEYQCRGLLKRCINTENVCDGVYHCPSGDDEVGCHKDENNAQNENNVQTTNQHLSPDQQITNNVTEEMQGDMYHKRYYDNCPHQKCIYRQPPRCPEPTPCEEPEEECPKCHRQRQCPTCPPEHECPTCPPPGRCPSCPTDPSCPVCPTRPTCPTCPPWDPCPSCPQRPLCPVCPSIPPCPSCPPIPTCPTCPPWRECPACQTQPPCPTCAPWVSCPDCPIPGPITTGPTQGIISPDPDPVIKCSPTPRPCYGQQPCYGCRRSRGCRGCQSCQGCRGQGCQGCGGHSSNCCDQQKTDYDYGYMSDGESKDEEKQTTITPFGKNAKEYVRKLERSDQCLKQCLGL